MLDIQKIYQESYDELVSIGIPVQKAIVSTRKFIKIAGKCQYTEKGFEIFIMEKLVNDDRYDLVKSTMIHELIHSCPGAFSSHNKKFREIARKVEDIGHYGLFEGYAHEDIYNPEMPVTKTFVCENCGRRFSSRRVDNRTEKECEWCHKTMKVIDPIDSFV